MSRPKKLFLPHKSACLTGPGRLIWTLGLSGPQTQNPKPLKYCLFEGVRKYSYLFSPFFLPSPNSWVIKPPPGRATPRCGLLIFSLIHFLICFWGILPDWGYWTANLKTIWTIWGYVSSLFKALFENDVFLFENIILPYLADCLFFMRKVKK